ncbi:O-antigen ligase family protein [Clostridium nigeriense]|uniref:O-antigen ligase family protein n=1 Tax=Clostridium nigeriense TaxID=1805470 RepID=UPI000835F9F5|nr:O-antigen ligase family protein [Clostridium nigeriense]
MKSLNKNYYYIILCSVLEILSIITLWGTEAKLTFLASIFGIPFVFLIIWYMDKSYENTILATFFSIFLLPLSGYIFLRIGLLDKQWMFYTVFYFIILFFLIKNGMFKRINRDKNIIKNKYIRFILLAMIIINVFFAFNKQVSIMIILLSFLPFIFLFYIVRTSNFKDKKSFYNKILEASILGALISVAPDFFYYMLSLIKGSTEKLYGPLGSNAILAYSLLMFIIVLGKWAKEKGIKNRWTLYVIGFSLSIGIQRSRGALIAIFSIFILYLIFNVKNWKKYGVVFLIVGIMVSANVFSRPDVSDEDTINEIHTIIEKPNNSNNKGNQKIKQVIIKVIESQSRTRQIIWKSALEITNDYTYTGVGLGNFKYFFNEYSGTTKSYIDAHNLLLNFSAEVGVPFMLIALILIVKMGIDSLIGYFKTKDKTRITYLSLGIVIAVFFIYGNLTGIAFNFTGEIYSFSSTFMMLFILFYMDYINEFV